MVTIVGFIEERIGSNYSFLVTVSLEPRVDILALLGMLPHTSNVRPVAAARGLPAQLSPEALRVERKTHMSNRFHTWLTPQELQEVQDRFRSKHGISDVALQDVLDMLALAEPADLRAVFWLVADEPRVQTPLEQHDIYGSAY